MTECTCIVDGCVKQAHSRGLCPMHYQRKRLRGDVGGAAPERHPNSGACSLDGCDQPMRKAGWCASHYEQWLKTGVVKAFTFKWADEPNCILCDKPNGNHRSRKFCSAACQQMWFRHRGVIPAEVSCPICGVMFSLADSGRNRRIRADALVCSGCKRRRPILSARKLAARDGSDCGICGRPVDLTIHGATPLAPSADHIIPWSRGGSDSPDNLRLAHFGCNAARGNRMAGAA